MATTSPQSDEERLRREALASWKRIQRELAATTAGLSDEERAALIDEISDAIDRTITERLRPGSMT